MFKLFILLCLDCIAILRLFLLLCLDCSYWVALIVTHRYFASLEEVSQVVYALRNREKCAQYFMTTHEVL